MLLAPFLTLFQLSLVASEWNSYSKTKNQASREAARAFKSFISVNLNDKSWFEIQNDIGLQNHGSDHQKIIQYTETPPLMEKMPDEDGFIAAMLKDLIIIK